MELPQATGRTIKADSPEGRRLLADSNEFGEPLWRQKYYDLCKKHGAPGLPPAAADGTKTAPVEHPPTVE
jgi:hypothetical protein